MNNYFVEILKTGYDIKFLNNNLTVTVLFFNKDSAHKVARLISKEGLMDQTYLELFFKESLQKINDTRNLT